jgi:hypothetical protein
MTLTNTVCRTPLDEESARRRGLYLTTHNTHNRQTSMSPAGFEPAISASEQKQTHALDRAATAIGILSSYLNFEMKIRPRHAGYIPSLCVLRRPQYVKHKCKVHPWTGHGFPEGEKRYSSTLSFTSAVDEGKWSTQHICRFTPLKLTWNPPYRILGWPQGLSEQVRKISSHRDTISEQSSSSESVSRALSVT